MTNLKCPKGHEVNSWMTVNKVTDKTGYWSAKFCTECKRPYFEMDCVSTSSNLESIDAEHPSNPRQLLGNPEQLKNEQSEGYINAYDAGYQDGYKEAKKDNNQVNTPCSPSGTTSSPLTADKKTDSSVDDTNVTEIDHKDDWIDFDKLKPEINQRIKIQWASYKTDEDYEIIEGIYVLSDYNNDNCLIQKDKKNVKLYNWKKWKPADHIQNKPGLSIFDYWKRAYPIKIIATGTFDECEHDLVFGYKPIFVRADILNGGVNAPNSYCRKCYISLPNINQPKQDDKPKHTHIPYEGSLLENEYKRIWKLYNKPKHTSIDKVIEALGKTEIPGEVYSDLVIYICRLIQKLKELKDK